MVILEDLIRKVKKNIYFFLQKNKNLKIGDSTGTHSIRTKHYGYEVMFHVSTYLPYYERDKQQVGQTNFQVEKKNFFRWKEKDI